MSRAQNKPCLNAIVFAISMFLAPTAVAVESDEGGEHTLILSTAMCEGDSVTMASCLDRQKRKADRWLNAIVESVARQASEAMVDLAHGGNTYDQVAQLHRSQAAFEQDRDQMSELINNYGLVGSINKLQAARTYFELTINRALLLLQTCASKPSIERSQNVDLARVDWCRQPYSLVAMVARCDHIVTRASPVNSITPDRRPGR